MNSLRGPSPKSSSVSLSGYSDLRSTSSIAMAGLHPRQQTQSNDLSHRGTARVASGDRDLPHGKAPLQDFYAGETESPCLDRRSHAGGSMDASKNSFYESFNEPAHYKTNGRVAETARNLQQPKTISADGGSETHGSLHGMSSAVNILGRVDTVVKPRYFKSRRVRRGDIVRPWLDQKDPREKWLTVIPCLGLLLGCCIAGFLIWDGLRTVINHRYCEVLDEDFSRGLDPNIWLREVEVGGFGNGQFEMTTTAEENIFTSSESGLTIRPTLQDEQLINHDTVINLTKTGKCTSHLWSDCVTSTNITNGTIVNPVKSGRLSTRKGPYIQYGRVEVTATLPAGDWLWPAIWMMPLNSTYGAWPQSGEIDIMEARGNNYSYPSGGNNLVSSTLHWGPSASTDAWWRTSSQRTAVHSTFATGPHVFGLEWSESYVFTYVDSRLLQVLYVDFTGENLWSRGDFPPADANGTRFIDPWSGTGHASTPFDQNFYLIIDLAVGATNGWFTDGVAGKPWVDASSTARRDFWDARDQWYPSWTNLGDFKIHRVRMWQQEGYNGCLERRPIG